MFTVEPNDHITFGIAWQDEHLLVIEKPARVPTQPGKGHASDTLLNGLFSRFGKQLQNLGAARDFGLLHRLDKDTSGLLIVGLRVPAYDKLREMFVKREIRKYYWAICDGELKEPSGVIRMPIMEGPGSDGNGPMKLGRISRTGSGAKPAITAYRVLEQSHMASLVEARPVTGRLHQIRLHMEAIGAPILGDRFYGPRRVHNASPRLALHAHRVAFAHPMTGAPIDVRSDWPGDLRRTLRLCGLHRPEMAKAPGAEEVDAPE
jgi:23S rRNA pseudouridine1911/1915/1917 synthase